MHKHTHARTHTHAHTHKHKLPQTHAHTHSLPTTHTRTHAHTIYPRRAHTHTHTHNLPQTQTRTHTVCPRHTRTLTVHPDAHTRTRTHTPPSSPQNYFHCACIPAPDDAYAPWATDELCPSPNCTLMPLWMAVFFVAMFLLFACSGMSISATVRYGRVRGGSRGESGGGWVQG